jgi:hypothetical protein
MPARVFISYAHADETFRDQLEKQLSILQRAGIVEIWNDRRLVAGEEWDHGIRFELERADIILLLVSPDFIASDYINDVEIARAMERHQAGSACVIPVILRPCKWEIAPFAKLQALPKDAKAISKWPNIDEAYLDVANGIHRAVEYLAKGSQTPRSAPGASASPVSTGASSPRSGNLRVTKRFTDADKDTFIRPATVNEIVRQRGIYKDAVQALANGNVAHGWELLQSMKAIHELPEETRIDRLAQDYLEAVEANRTVLVVSPTHAEKDKITAAIRDELQSAGRLGEARTFIVWRELQWTQAQKSDPSHYAPGQWVRFTQNAATQNATSIVKGAKLEVIGRSDDNQVLARNTNNETVALPLTKPAIFKVYAPSQKSFAVGDLVRITENGQTPGGTFVNGAIHTVTGFDKQGNLILDKTKTLPCDYGAFDHGYASTSVAAQGRTVDTVLIALGTASIPAMSQEQLYVSASRARTACHIYTDDAETVRHAVQRTSHRGSATELVEGALDRKLKPVTEQSRAERLKAFSTRLAEQFGRAERARRRENRELDRDEVKALPARRSS